MPPPSLWNQAFGGTPGQSNSLWGQLSSILGQGGPSPFAQAYNPWGATGAAQSAFAQGAGPNPAQFMPPMPAGGGMPPGGGGMPGGTPQPSMAQLLAMQQAYNQQPQMPPGAAGGLPMGNTGMMQPGMAQLLAMQRAAGPMQTPQQGPPPGFMPPPLPSGMPSGPGVYGMPGGGGTMSSLFSGGKGPGR